MTFWRWAPCSKAQISSIIPCFYPSTVGGFGWCTCFLRWLRRKKSLGQVFLLAKKWQFGLIEHGLVMANWSWAAILLPYTECSRCLEQSFFLQPGSGWHLELGLQDPRAETSWISKARSIMCLRRAFHMLVEVRATFADARQRDFSGGILNAPLTCLIAFLSVSGWPDLDQSRLIKLSGLVLELRANFLKCALNLLWTVDDGM